MEIVDDCCEICFLFLIIIFIRITINIFYKEVFRYKILSFLLIKQTTKQRDQHVHQRHLAFQTVTKIEDVHNYL